MNTCIINYHLTIIAPADPTRPCDSKMWKKFTVKSKYKTNELKITERGKQRTC